MNPTNWQHLMASQRDLISCAKNDEVRACGERVLKILDYLSRGDAVFKELVRLQEEEPDLFAAFCRLVRMGARLSDIRTTEQFAEEAGL
jgi:hypothetical protein